MRPWGPSALHPNGFVAHQSTLTNGTSFGRESNSLKSPREKLLKIMDTISIGSLEPEDASIFRLIDRERPWLLTKREIALLEKLSQLN